MTQMTYKVLIADDEERIRKIIRMYMELEQAIVEETHNGEQALIMAIDTDYDLIIMDRLMSGLSGLEVCHMLKSIKNTPIILLTERSDEADRILGFQAGADDCVCKPFSPRELLLRAKAILKRTIPEQFWLPAPFPSGQIVFPNLVIDHHARRVLVEGEEIYLTLKEYELLRYFSLHVGKICTRELLLMEIWNYEENGDHRTVDTHVKRLRDKMHKVSPTAASMIRTVWGTGYRMDDIT
ncbi:response regulator transcription factor [Paenibacillus periandrae]|uniref:response regulator transcription factor n=1 Tax=Paenibacillus periandrae TaxID=1761741 RepID=UPI001F09F68E|nr:response regulator transcription factor [Paenibacillus periandrae]